MKNGLVAARGEGGVRGGREVSMVTKGQHTGREVCTPTFTAALLAVAKDGSDPRAHRQTNGRIKHALYTVEYCSALKWEEIRHRLQHG